MQGCVMGVVYWGMTHVAVCFLIFTTQQSTQNPTQADRFAAQLDHGPQLKEALMVLDKENKVSAGAGCVRGWRSCARVEVVCMVVAQEGRAWCTVLLHTFPCHTQSAINVDKLYSTYHYTHPPVVERLQAIDGLMKKST